MEGLFSASNSNHLLLPIIIVGAAFLTASYITWHKKHRIHKILSNAIIAFLIIYLPLLDYWSFWKASWFWPSDFYHESGIVLTSSDDFQFGYYPITQIIFNTLSILSGFLFLFTTILFIKNVNLKQPNINKLFNWIPLINSFSLGYQIKKMTNQKWTNRALILFWSFFTFLFTYYNFVVGWLYFEGFDSITFIDKILFPHAENHTEENNNYDIGYTYVADIISVVTPPLKYISGILTLLVLIVIKKNTESELDAEISKIGRNNT
ncbi:hypothetical protein [Hyunsoonleella ulvae]|uniref:hypothetical protein n=1 Tax=Hyunsoonleella ulvae TaxID=2799948 RepID=UPI0019397431|nr:hypothetical protein [Hyunsoonleella ulvae]